MKENEPSTSLHKTPVSLLQEICAKKGLKIEFKLVANDGPLHRPEFTYVLTAGHLNVTASGTNKKQAKHNVALEMLNTMLKPHSVSPCLSNSSLNEESQYPNPIGKVQELSQKMLWSPPIYEFSLEKGQPHHKLFNCTVSLMKYSMRGYGSSKKLAKRDATTKLLAMLKDKNIINEATLSNEDNSKNNSTNNGSGEKNIKNDNNVVTTCDTNKDLSHHPPCHKVPLQLIEDIYDSLKNGPSLPNLTPEFSQKIARFYQQLKYKMGKTLASLQMLPLNNDITNYCQLLQEIAEEQSFEVTYIDYPGLTFKNEYQCLVQLCETGVAVCHGTGDSVESAHSDAAHNSLQYLKIMTRK